MVGPNGVVAPGTRLSQQLEELEGKADARTAFRLARRTFVAGHRVDMQDLAAELGVNRTTLFRWVGNRDQLLAEVIWSLAGPTFQQAMDQAPGSGAGRVANVLSRFLRAATTPDFFRAYLRREPERAMRLLTTKASGFQRRLVAEVERLLVEEQADHEAAYPLPVHDLAYVIVRIAEGFVYADLITNETPDLDKAATAIGALLGLRPNEFDNEKESS